MQLQTLIPLSPQQPSIDYHSKVVLLGSCFAENIGAKLDYFKFQNVQNPFGVIFNPASMEKLLHRVLNGTPFSDQDVFLHNEQWHSYEVHSRCSSSNKKEMITNLNRGLEDLESWIRTASHIILTLGSAWVYRSIKTTEIVANCHKVPQKEFSKELLSIEQLSELFVALIGTIKELNPTATILFTVSPVRHIKDGMQENTRSKSHLISAVHQVLEKNDDCFYFPSYELMMDELRDYRFYAEDMIHPNTTAIQYLWERFQEVWISQSAQPIQSEIEAIQKGLQHRPFHPDSEGHRTFQLNLQARMLRLSEQYPHITFMI